MHDDKYHHFLEQQGHAYQYLSMEIKISTYLWNHARCYWWCFIQFSWVFCCPRPWLPPKHWLYMFPVPGLTKPSSYHTSPYWKGVWMISECSTLSMGMIVWKDGNGINLSHVNLSLFMFMLHLTHCGLLSPYDNIDLGQNGLIAYRL